MAFGEDYQQPAAPRRLSSVTADPRVVICTIDLAIGKQSTSFFTADSSHKWTVSDFTGGEPTGSSLLARPLLSPSQYIPVDRHINDSVQKKPAIPQLRADLLNESKFPLRPPF